MQLGCEYHLVVNQMRAASTYGIVSSNWEALAHNLNVRGEVIDQFRTGILNGSTEKYTILIKVLQIWRMENSTTATLGKLIEILEILEWIDVIGNSLLKYQLNQSI